MKKHDTQFNGLPFEVFMNEEGEPIFMAGQVTKILGLGNVTNALRNLEEDEKLTLQFVKSGQNRNFIMITESGLYNLIFRSNKIEAKEFRRWVSSEVLPSIRKYGAYITKEKLEELEGRPQEFDKLLKDLKKETAKKEKAEKFIEDNKKYYELSRTLFGSHSNICIEDFTKLLKSKYENMEVSYLWVFEWMRNNGHLLYNGPKRNHPPTRHIESGYMELRTIALKSKEGKDYFKFQPRLTPKGIEYFEGLIKEHLGL